MRQCSSDFKQKRRYVKKTTEAKSDGEETGGRRGGKEEETVSTFISFAPPHQWRHAAILIKTKNKHR